LAYESAECRGGGKYWKGGKGARGWAARRGSHSIRVHLGLARETIADLDGVKSGWARSKKKVFSRNWTGWARGRSRRQRSNRAVKEKPEKG